MLLAFRIVALGIGPSLKGEIMSPDYSKQRGALIALAVAYEGARDFTRRVLQTAFGDPPPDDPRPASCHPTTPRQQWEAIFRVPQAGVSSTLSDRVTRQHTAAGNEPCSRRTEPQQSHPRGWLFLLAHHIPTIAP